MLRLKLVLLATLMLASLRVEAAGLPLPFEADYEVYRNGKLIGETTISFAVAGDQWTMRSDTEGTKGIARFLRLKEWSLGEGEWIDGAPRPDNFRQEVKVAIKTITTAADFDWQAGTVLSVHKDGEHTLEVVPGLLDPVSLGLWVRAGLAAGEQEWRLPMVDEDRIEEEHFRVAEAVPLSTALGCQNTHRVDKIRGPQSKRYTQTWYADELGFVPVYMVHGKQDGDHMESRIVSLTLDGELVSVDGSETPCPD